MPSLPDLRILQAVVIASSRGVRMLGSSDGFDASEAERIAVLFGSRPVGTACPLAHFAVPFGTTSVAVVTVTDQPNGDLGFRFLVLDRGLYQHLGDPFSIADRFPPDWSASGTLPVLAWPAEPLPRRTVAAVQNVLKTGDGPLLLGSAQSLVDGGEVLLQRAAPDEAFVRGLWQLLPDKVRCDLWPATFAFSNELGFHAAMLPELVPDRRGIRRSEEGLRDYPQSSYELNLQIAVENGDQAALDALFARRTSSETLRLGLYIIAFALVAAALVKFLL
jgi:hypothetical protein